MSAIPYGSQELSLDEAVNYHLGWTADDRRLAYEAVARVGVTDFYVPPSGGYVAGHGGGKYSDGWYRVAPVNGLYMHVGSLVLWPNMGRREVWPLSQHRLIAARAGASRHPSAEPPLCPRCRLQHVGECL